MYEACGVCILELKDGTVIYMLVERRYPLSKEWLQRMLDLRLEDEEESTDALHLAHAHPRPVVLVVSVDPRGQVTADDAEDMTRGEPPSSSSDNAVQKCSKQCLESFKTLQKNYDSEREKHSRARLEFQGYELALEPLESRILVHEKNELAWGEKYEFQNYELKCREIKIKNLNLELEKVVKERDELKLKTEKWEESSKNLDELLNSQMSARDKTGLGYGTQLNEMSKNSKTDSDISLSVFDVRSSDEV
ncbi:hypothetical protein Tco_1312986 [Tanacetum coccineum]